MVYYNLTNATATVNNVADITQQANHLVGDVMGIFIIIVLFCILFLSMKNFSTKTAWLAASFISAVLSLFLRILELIGDKVFWIVMIILLISLVASVFTNVD